MPRKSEKFAQIIRLNPEALDHAGYATLPEAEKDKYVLRRGCVYFPKTLDKFIIKASKQGKPRVCWV